MDQNTEANAPQEEILEPNQDDQASPGADKPKEALYDVPDYANCSDKERAAMEEYIRSVDIHDINTILGFGEDALRELGEVAEDIMKQSVEQAAFTASLDGIDDKMATLGFSQITDKITGMGNKGLGYLIRNPGTSAATLGAMVLAGPAAIGIPFVKNAYDKVQRKKNGADIEEIIRDTITRTDELTNELQTVQDSIPATLDVLRQLALSRMHSYKKVSLIIGAGIELIRRIDEDTLPELQQQLDALHSHETEVTIQLIEQSRNLLDQRITDLLLSRTVSQATATSLSNLQNVFIAASQKLGSHLTLSVPQWRTQCAEAGIFLAANQASKIIDEADKHGTKMLANGAAITARTTKMIRDSMGKGTYDPARAIEALSSAQQAFKQQVTTVGQIGQESERVRAQLSNAATKHVEEIAKIAEKARGTGLGTLTDQSTAGTPQLRKLEQ